MKRVFRIFLLGSVLLLFAVSVVQAAAPSNLKATKTATGQTTLTWTAGTGTDDIEYSLDGLTWVPVQAASAPSGVRRDPSAVTGNAKVIGLTDYTNYYFRLSNNNGGAVTYSNVVDAFPPNEHAHKYFASDTNQCGMCHSTHTGQAAKMLKATSLNSTCKTCHAGGTGSKYQVDMGTVAGPGGTSLAALAGLFGTRFNEAPGVPTPTRSHPIRERLLRDAQGGPGSNGENGWGEEISCGSCHSAHSSLDYQYRLLRSKLPNMKQSTASGTTTLLSLDVKAYAVTMAGKEGANYVSGMNNFCGGCHADYNTSGVDGSGHTRSGVFTPVFYRHAVGKEISAYGGLSTTLPLEEGTVPSIWDGSEKASGKVFCMTCHRPHGARTTGNTVMLRLNGKAGVCEDCHKK